MYMFMCACLLIMHTLFSCVHSRKCRSKRGWQGKGIEEHLKRKAEEGPLGGRFWNKPGDQEITLISANNINEVNFTPQIVFISCHKFSIGLQSGDSEGVFHQLISLSWKIVANLDVCLGSSCMERWESG